MGAHHRERAHVDGLAERKVRPDELFADTAYGSGRNAFEPRRERTGKARWRGRRRGTSTERVGPPPLTAADFGSTSAVGASHGVPRGLTRPSVVRL